MTIWLVHIPQSKWEFRLFDNYTKETELLVIAEDQKKSVFCFICFHSPWTESHATSHLVQMKVQRVCKSGAEWERQAVEEKPWFLFPFVTSLGCCVAIKVEPAIRLGLTFQFWVWVLTDPVRAEKNMWKLNLELGHRVLWCWWTFYLFGIGRSCRNMFASVDHRLGSGVHSDNGWQHFFFLF